jgi:hypothetical protein
LAPSLATMPSPLGPGMIRILTEPRLPSVSYGREWGCPHLHSQLPHPLLTIVMLSRASWAAFSMALRTCLAFPAPSPRYPSWFPTATMALNRDFSPASLCFWTRLTLMTSSCRLGTSMSTIWDSRTFMPSAKPSSSEEIFPSWTSLPSFVRGFHCASCSSRRSRGGGRRCRLLLLKLFT